MQRLALQGRFDAGELRFGVFFFFFFWFDVQEHEEVVGGGGVKKKKEKNRKETEGSVLNVMSIAAVWCFVGCEGGAAEPLLQHHGQS